MARPLIQMALDSLDFDATVNLATPTINVCELNLSTTKFVTINTGLQKIVIDTLQKTLSVNVTEKEDVYSDDKECVVIDSLSNSIGIYNHHNFSYPEYEHKPNIPPEKNWTKLNKNYKSKK